MGCERVGQARQLQCEGSWEGERQGRGACPRSKKVSITDVGAIRTVGRVEKDPCVSQAKIGVNVILLKAPRSSDCIN